MVTNATGAGTPEPSEAPEKRRFWHALKRERYAGWSLYFWHGMRVRAWFNLMRRNNFKTNLKCLPNVLSVSMIAPWNSLLYRITEAIYGRRAEATEIPPPVFVIGHWRTGTTYLHDLLASDPGYGYPTTYECFFPNHFLLTERVARFWFKFALPEKRPQDDVEVGVDRPQEDEFALCNMGIGSIYFTWALQHRGPVDQAYLDLRMLGEDEKKKWNEALLWFIRRVTLQQKKPLILKTPQHTARLATLIKLFPKARFIHIARNPAAVFPSTMRLWKSMDSIQGLENPPNDDPWLEPYIVDQFMRVFRAYEEDRGLIPEGQLAEIRYEDLVADPKGTLKRLYGELGLGDFANAEPAVDAYLSKTKDYKTNAYQLPPEQKQRIESTWGPYYDRFGYERSDESSAS